MSPNYQSEVEGNSALKWIIPGVAVGAAIIFYAVRSRKQTKWDRVTGALTHGKAQLADTGKSLWDRIRIISEETSRAVEEAGQLWEHGRKLVRR